LIVMSLTLTLGMDASPDRLCARRYALAPNEVNG
jgi:hypothetical protein